MDSYRDLIPDRLRRKLSKYRFEIRHIIVLFAVLNAQARGKLAVANTELAFLRPEVARLRSTLGAAASGPSTWPTGAGWYPDPMQRHEYRQWTGTGWSDDVSDGGVVARDPISGWGT